MNEQDRIAAINAKLVEEKPRAWRFPTKPGAEADGKTCVGEFVRRSSFFTKDEGKEVETVILRVNGELRSVALFHAPLKSQLGQDVDLRPGELVGITYEGMATSRLTDRQYHNYKVVRENNDTEGDLPPFVRGSTREYDPEGDRGPFTPAPVSAGGPNDGNERDDESIPF